jgi:hypothetical protein
MLRIKNENDHQVSFRCHNADGKDTIVYLEPREETVENVKVDPAWGIPSGVSAVQEEQKEPEIIGC